MQVFSEQSLISSIDDKSGIYASIAIDSNDKAHLSYYDAINGELKYATKSGGQPSDKPDIKVSSTNVNFGSVDIGSSLGQTVTVSNVGTADLIIGTITLPPPPFSKTVDDCSGHTLSPTQTCTITYRFAPTSGGTFSGNSNIPSNDPDENPKTVSLSGTGVVPSGGVLSVTPSEGLSASGNQGGPFSPSSKPYTLTNTGGSSINWTVSKAQAWVSLSSTSGALTAGANTTVTVSINTNAYGLTQGSYSDTVTFTNTTNGSGNTSRSVSLTVTAPSGILTVTPADELIDLRKSNATLDLNRMPIN